MSAKVWRRFRKHRLALAGLGVIMAIIALCLLVPWAAKYDPGRTHLDLIRDT